jgi:DNA-binding CsgD family transcriptional regulator
MKSFSLSPREREVLKWLKHGKTSWDISVILRISERTVNYHVDNIMKKLDVTSRLQAVSEAANLETNGDD